jgi:glutathione-independent formaldehyde dehydrogenase
MRSLQGGQRSICACRTPISSDELARKGRMAFDFGEFWTKGLRMGTGQTNVKSYNRRLCRIIETHKAQPELIVSHQLSLDEAPEAYKHFDARENGWTKVVLRPRGKQAPTRPASPGRRGAQA